MFRLISKASMTMQRNAGVTGRFVERQRNKPVPLTHWLYGPHSLATLLFVDLVNHTLANKFLSIASKLRLQP